RSRSRRSRPGRVHPRRRIPRPHVCRSGAQHRQPRRVHAAQRADAARSTKPGLRGDRARAERGWRAQGRPAGRRRLRPVSARIWSILFKEFIQIRRDPRTLAIVLVMPLMQLLLFGYAINTTVDHIATVVLDQARDAQSRRFLATFFNTGYFDLAAEASSLEEVRSAIDTGAAHVGIGLPPDLSRDQGAG